MIARYCPDAARIAAKIRAIEEKHAPRPAMARYSVFMHTRRGYKHFTTIEAPSLRDACKAFISAWPSRVELCKVVMRAPDGKRYGYEASVRDVAGCGCETCRPLTVEDMRMIVCATCGYKRCPHATDHRNACTGSNASGQAGSSYGVREVARV